MRNIRCKDCIHDGVCYLQEVCSDIEDQLEKFGCEDYKQRINLDGVRTIDANKLAVEISRVYMEHYEKSRDKTIDDIFNAVFKRIAKAPQIDMKGAHK